MRQYSLDEWRDLARAFYDIRLKTPPQMFSAEADFSGAGPLILTKVRFTPQIFDRDPAKIKGSDRGAGARLISWADGMSRRLARRPGTERTVRAGY